MLLKSNLWIDDNINEKEKGSAIVHLGKALSEKNELNFRESMTDSISSSENR